MNTDASVFLTLVGGFYFVIRCQLLYLISLQLGQAIAVLLSALFACLFAMLSRLVVSTLALTPWQSALQGFSAMLWPSPYGGTALGAFALALLTAELTAHYLKTQRVTRWVIKNFAGDMVKLLYESMLQLKPVSLTLDTRKFYIGFVQEIPSLDPSKAFVRLLPMLSGYREEKALTFQFTTPYNAALEQAADKNDFVIVIPLQAIKSANLFDPTTHAKHFEQPLLQADGA